MITPNKTEKRILNEMLIWNYSAGRCNTFGLAMKLGISESTAYKNIRAMIYRGWLVSRKRDGKQSLFINESMRDEIRKEVLSV